VNGGEVNEAVGRAIVGLDEAESLLGIWMTVHSKRSSKKRLSEKVSTKEQS